MDLEVEEGVGRDEEDVLFVGVFGANRDLFVLHDTCGCP